MTMRIIALIWAYWFSNVLGRRVRVNLRLQSSPLEAGSDRQESLGPYKGLLSMLLANPAVGWKAIGHLQISGAIRCRGTAKALKTARLGSPLLKDVDFSFLFKEDTDPVDAPLGSDIPQYVQNLSIQDWRQKVVESISSEDLDAAFNILESMQSAGYANDPVALSRVITACTRADWPWLVKARELLISLYKANCTAEPKLWNMVASSMARKGKWQSAAIFLVEMRECGVERTVASFNSLLAVFSRKGKWVDALKMLNQMETDGPPPDVASYSSVMAACQRAKQWEHSVALLKRLNTSSSPISKGAKKTKSASSAADVEAHAPEANEVTYALTIQSLTGAGKWREAIKLYDELPLNISSAEGVINAAVAAAASGKDVRLVTRILKVAIERGAKPRGSSFILAISACEASANYQGALFLLELMKPLFWEPEQAPTRALAFESVLRTMRNGGRWKLAGRFIGQMLEDKLRPTVKAFNYAIFACTKDVTPRSEDTMMSVEKTNSSSRYRSGGDMALWLLDQMKECGHRPNVQSYTYVIQALSRTGQWLRVLTMLNLMDDDNIDADEYSWSAAITALVKAENYDMALGLFNNLREMSDKDVASERVWTAGISAAASSGDVSYARQLMFEMEAAGIKPTVFTYNAVLSGCSNSADDTLARTLMEEMAESADVEPDLTSYRRALSTYGNAGRWELALGLFTQMAVMGLAIDDFTYGSFMRSLLTANKWDIVLSIFEQMLATNDPALRSLNVISPAIGACAMGSQREKALAIFQLLKSWDIRPDLRCYHGVADACASTGDWEGSYAMWEEPIRLGLKPLAVTYQVAMEACFKAKEHDRVAKIQQHAERNDVPLVALSLAGLPKRDSSWLDLMAVPD